MSPLFLYPSITNKLGKGGGDTSSLVFANGERMRNAPDPFTTSSVFWKQFVSPVYRIPNLVITDSGRIIAVSDYRSSARDQIAITPAVAISDDGGKTWTKKLIDLEPLKDNANCRVMDPTIFIFKGVVSIICGAWDGSANNKNWTQTRNDPTWSVIRYYSNDNGETWFKEYHFENSIRTNKPTDGSSWLGGVGHCITTKNGTCLVPIQISRAVGKVSATCIFTNDGVNWTMFSTFLDNLSETSLAQWLNTRGEVEIALISRRDPNTGNTKAVNYTVERSQGKFNAFAVYPIYNSKIPARGSSGCNGGAIMLCDENGNHAPLQQLLVSYAGNYFNNINAYIRDHINIAGFPFTKPDDPNSRLIRDYECINLNTGAFENGIPYGGYSNLAFNIKSNRLGILYEDMLGIRYKDLSHLLPILKYEGAK